jgi:hypothetical protein
LSPASERLKVDWRPRDRPLVPEGQVATGRVAQALARRLLRSDPEALARLKGVAGDDVLVVLGEPGDLPWVEGIAYVGRDPRAPALYMPTNLEPVVLPDLLQAAVLRKSAGGVPPVVILPSPAVIVAVGSGRPIERAALETWLGMKA